MCGWLKCPTRIGGSWSGGGGGKARPPPGGGGRRVRDNAAPAREVERARIVLLVDEGVPGKQIAAWVGCAEPTVVTWPRRYAERGLPGLEDHPRPGSPSPLPEALRDRVLQLTLT